MTSPVDLLHLMKKPIRTPGYDNTQYKQNTRRDCIGLLKRFYLWMIDEDKSTIPLKKVIKIIPPKRNDLTVTREDLPTKDELGRMLGHVWRGLCKNPKAHK